MKKAVILIVIITGIVSIVWFQFFFVKSHKSHFTGPVSEADPLPYELISELEDYVRKKMAENKVPGAAMVLVRGNEIIYNKGLGVRDFESKEPVTTETLFGIGSVTKPMTAVVIGSLIDKGLFTWNTKVTELLPNFELSNQYATNKITIEDTLCMCTGLPRRMEEISVSYNEMSAEDIIESLSTIPLQGSYGSTYNYSSRMVSAGGYIAAMAAGGNYGNLAEAYRNMVQENLFDPLEMTASTFSIEEALTSGNYALPHYSSLSGLQAISPDIEGIFTPIAPAGALWSNAEDMSKFVIMLLNNGISNNGKEIITSENLAHLWEPRVTVDPNISYGLCWNIENYNGLTVFFHPGGTVGFASELVIIPELDTGFVFMTNQLNQVSPIGRLATYRLLEMLTGSEQVYDRETGRTARDLQFQLLQLKLVTRKKVNPDKITQFLGKYNNDTLGEIELTLHEDNTLWIDFGEYESSLRPFFFEDNKFIFFESVFVGKTVTLNTRSDGRRILQWSGDEGIYTFND